MTEEQTNIKPYSVSGRVMHRDIYKTMLVLLLLFIDSNNNI